MVGDLAHYRIVSNRTNLYVFINLQTVKDYDDFKNIFFVKWFMNDSSFTFQKIWNFFYTTPILEAWWKSDNIYSEFIVKDNKFKKIYSKNNIDLFISERLITLDILPSHVFDFLGIYSSEDLRIYDKNATLAKKELLFCKSCYRHMFPSEIIEQFSYHEGICWYCVNILSPYDRRRIETPYLFRKRIVETWKSLSIIQREQLLFGILREFRKPKKISDVHYLKLLSRQLAEVDDVYKLSGVSKQELETLVYKLDVDYFIKWWENIK
ncbi:MAG: hypothetical protein N2712_03250 [Brevinematales bacterium]|nr:hypothetical protein [Brevinematales bacterium]